MPFSTRLRVLAALGLLVPLGVSGSLAPAQGTPRGQDGWLYYVPTDGPSAAEIWRVRPGQADTAEPVTTGHEDDRATPSPDGRTIAFRRIDDTPTPGEPVMQLWMMDADGSDQRQVDLSGLNLLSPAFSPDGRTLLLTASGGQTFNLWTATLSGTRLHPLLDWDVAAALRPTAPTYTPDGRRLLFAGDQPGSSVRDLWTARADGTDRRRLTTDAATEDSPDVSPDGSRVAFVVQDATTFVRSVVVMRLDGTGRRTVPGLEDPTLVRWTPDGKELVVTQGTPRRVVVVTPSTGATSPGSPGLGADELGGVVAPAGATCDGRPATIVGGAAGETIVGSVGHDVIVGGAGGDTIDGLGGDDVICGGTGNDVITGGTGVDRLFGQSGSDTLRARDSRRDGRIDCGADRDPVAGRDAGVDPAAVSCG